MSVLYAYHNLKNFLCLKPLQKKKLTGTFSELKLNHMMGFFCVQNSNFIIATYHNSVRSCDNAVIKDLGSFFIPHSVKTMIGNAPLAKTFKD